MLLKFVISLSGGHCNFSPRRPRNFATPLIPAFLLFSIRLSPTVEYVTIFSVPQPQSSYGMFFTSECCQSLLLCSLFQRQQKPYSHIEHKTTAQRSQTLCLAPGTSHFVTLWRRHSGATSEKPGAALLSALCQK
jgi:hypothetical protein